MTLAFAYSDKEDAEMPPQAVQACLVLRDIEIAATSSVPAGDGQVLDDGSVLIKYHGFKIVVKPDGSFHGRRMVTSDRQIKGHVNGKAPG